MPQKPLTTEQIQEALDAYEFAGRVATAAAESLNLKQSTFDHRLKSARRMDLKPSKHVRNPDTDTNLLHDEIRKLKAEINSSKKATLDDEYVKRKIIGLADSKPDVPSWMLKPSKSKKNVGVPTLFASDWHWGEVVDPKQIGGVNEFNMTIAQERARAMIEVAIDICRNHLNIEAPGIVFALGGDMVSGDLHDELSATNEKEIMPTVVDLFGVLIWCINRLADEFGNVFVPCVAGNHGRNTHKVRNKGYNFTNFDWLTYQFLSKHFEKDKRVCFHIPDGPDALYSVFGHRYLLTHGNQFRSFGDSVIGSLGPVVRGDHKKRSRNAQINAEYQTLILGHFHQLIQMERVIVNGSLKGYCEYAYANNFGYEPARQALWVTSPGYGITFSAPVLVDRHKREFSKEWVSWK